jgi:hypothetical protein
MASEILYAGLADQRTAETLSGDFLYALAARDGLPQHPALMQAPDAMGRGSTVIKIPQLGLNGFDLAVATADGASVANTALTDASSTVTIARYSKAYEMSDLARLTDTGMLNAQAFANDAVVTYNQQIVNLLANLMGGFSQTAGSTGVNLSVANFLAASALLEVGNVAGPYLAILHPQQVADLKSELASTTAGALQWMPATAAQIETIGTGVRSAWAGVDIFTTSRVPSANAGADRAGGMFGRGAVAWGFSSIMTSGSADELVIGGRILFERDRTARAGLTAYVSHYYLGASECIDAAGVAVITDL